MRVMSWRCGPVRQGCRGKSGKDGSAAGVQGEKQERWKCGRGAGEKWERWKKIMQGMSAAHE
eukprot:342021-Chlamydomonas_euryale.AAC.2